MKTDICILGKQLNCNLQVKGQYILFAVFSKNEWFFQVEADFFVLTFVKPIELMNFLFYYKLKQFNCVLLGSKVI